MPDAAQQRVQRGGPARCWRHGGPVDEPAYRRTTSQFGGLIGDHVQTGSMITLGPGIAVGRHSTIAASVCMGSSIVPAASVVRSSSPEVLIEPRRI
ncbi:hypothetical protein ACFV2Q_38955 [Streptomyces sp. NPDC059650]|uniref:hypothetical protein n=1 Tax=Streptomyces sp. NPDC059650 TaxID=3346896 RepID=UPI0036AED9BC